MTTVFINTRPTPKPMPLLTQHGIVVRSLPLLEIFPCQLSEMEKESEHRLIAGEYQLLMVVSVTAVNLAMARLGNKLEKLRKLNKNNQLTIIAVGKTTALAIENYGLTATYPDGSNASNEGMLALSQVQNLKAGSSVLVWAGVGGRTLFIDTLIARGLTVHKIAYYQRLMPKNLKKQGEAILTNEQYFNKRWVLISSGQAWEHWQDLCQQLHLTLDNFGYVVLGERLAKMVNGAAKAERQIKSVTQLSESAILGVLL